VSVGGTVRVPRIDDLSASTVDTSAQLNAQGSAVCMQCGVAMPPDDDGTCASMCAAELACADTQATSVCPEHMVMTAPTMCAQRAPTAEQPARVGLVVRCVPVGVSLG